MQSQRFVKCCTKQDINPYPFIYKKHTLEMQFRFAISSAKRVLKRIPFVIPLGLKGCYFSSHLKSNIILFPSAWRCNYQFSFKIQHTAKREENNGSLSYWKALPCYACMPSGTVRVRPHPHEKNFLQH